MRAPRLSYSNVMATIAVFLALGGGAYALSLGKNAVKRKNLAPNAVNSKKIAPNAVKGVDALESSFGTVPNAAELGGSPPGTFVSGLNSIQRVHNEAVPVGGDGVVFSIAGVGTIQFLDCQQPDPSTALGAVTYVNESSQDQDIWATGNTVNQYVFQEPNSLATPVFPFPDNALMGRIDLQVGSRGAPSQVTVATLTAVYDFVPIGDDFCRYSLWTSKTEEEQG